MQRYVPFLLTLFLTAVLAVPFLGAEGAGPTDGRGSEGTLERPGTYHILATPDPTFHEVILDDRPWTLPELEGAIYPPTDGEPSVPVLVRRLELPNDIKCIRIVRSDPVKYVLEHPIPPSYAPAVIGSEVWNYGTENTLVPDEDAYLSTGPFPARPVTWTHLGYGWENGTRHSSYSVTYAPMDYDPSRNELTVYGDIGIEVEEQGPEMSLITAPSRTDPPASLVEGTELLVIAHDPFMDDLGDYIEWKKETGRTVTLVGFGTVNSAYPSLDGPSSIWSYVRDSFFGDGQTLRWVLLAGEHRFVPSRMVYDLDPYYGEPQYLPADTYYSCLDGAYTNWDSDGDGRWAEMGDISDMEPEVYVSRISLDTETEARGWAGKVVSYEKNPPSGQWSRTAGFFGSTTHYSDDGPTESEDLWDIYLDRVHTARDRYYSQGPTQQYTGAKLLNYGNIQEGLTAGFSTLNYMGHGHYAVWSEGTQEDNTIIYTVNEASSLSNGARLPLIFAMSCETNWFDDAGFESISEEFTENSGGGAIAYLGAVRTTEGGIGFTPHQYTPGAPGIQEDVLRMIANGKRSIAEILLEAKEYYFTQWASYFYYYQFAYNAWVEHSVLGPPDTEIWTAEPRTLSVAHSHINDRYTNITVTVLDHQGDPLEGATVCIRSAALDATSKDVTDQYGTVVVPFEITTTANAKITVTSPGCRPFQTSIVLSDDTPPKVDLVKVILNPDGGSGWYLNDPILSFSSSEPCEVRYRWNGGDDQRYTGVLGTMKGQNTLEFWGKDAFGNTGTVSHEVIMYDPDPPVVKLVQTPPAPDGKNGWFITAPVVELELSGPSGSEEKLEYWLDRSVRQIYSGPVQIPEGEHELHVLASDKAGNRAEQLDLGFKVDTTVPHTTLSTGGIERNDRGYFTEPMTVTLRTEDPSAKVYFRWDGALEWSIYSAPIDPLTGDHTLHYRSEDSHGNVEPQRTENLAYDIVPPVLRYTISPQQPSGSNGWYTKAPSISLSGEDDTGNYSITYELKGEALPYERPITLPEGISTLEASIVDGAGNHGEDLSITFKVDSIVDRTSLYTDASPSLEGWFLDTPMITLRTDGKASIHYRFLGYGDFIRYSGAFLPPSDEGSFQLEFYCVDEAGNRETVRTHYLSVDARAPVVSATGPSSCGVGDRVEYDLSGSSDGVGTVEFYFDPGDGSGGDWVRDPKVAHRYTKGGKYSLTFKARDAAGHESEPFKASVTVHEDSIAPYIIVGGAVVLMLVMGGLVLLLVASRRHHGPPPHHPVRHHPHTRYPPHHAQLHHPHGPSAAARPPLPPKGVPQHQRPAGVGPMVAGSGGLPAKLPGPKPGFADKGPQPGGPALTPHHGKLNDLIDRPVGRGQPPAAGQPGKPPEKVPLRPPQKPMDIPEPPKPPTF